MGNFTICPPADMDVGTIIETLNRSGPPPTAPALAPNQVDPPLSSLHSSDRTSWSELPCPDYHFDASDNQLDYRPLFDSDDQQILDSHPAQIPISVETVSRILDDKQIL
jgi:lipopolysaccharide assembly outer membrane protein LptD (OstA)